jgi:hypothetical protein
MPCVRRAKFLRPCAQKFWQNLQSAPQCLCATAPWATAPLCLSLYLCRLHALMSSACRLSMRLSLCVCIRWSMWLCAVAAR